MTNEDPWDQAIMQKIALPGKVVKRGETMVKIIGKDGKVSHDSAPSVAKLRHVQELKLITESTVAFVTKKTDDVLSLQEIKNYLKAIKDNPFNLHLEKGHANAHIRADCQSLRGKELIHAKEFGNRVIFFNPHAVRELLSDTKDAKRAASIKERFDILQNLPRRESYY